MSVREIGSDAICEQLPGALRQWLSLERFHLHRPDLFQCTAEHPDFDTRYLPQHAQVARLPCFFVPARTVYTFGSQQRDQISTQIPGYASPEWVLFPVHPSALDHYREFLRNVDARDVTDEGVRIWALPTSSTRTLLAWIDERPDTATFVKTSLHSQIFGERRVLRQNAARSVGLSSMMSAERAQLPTSLCCLAESFAFCARQSPHAGTIVREVPPEFFDERRKVVPLFALLGGSGTHTPVLRTILERSSDPPLQFVHDVLCEPFARLWLELSMKFGWVLEAHGQDLMLDFDADLAFTGRFYYRDFEGLQVDWELRRALRGPQLASLPHEWAWRQAYGGWEGDPFAESVWYKWRMSLLQYLHLVLHETETSLREWQQQGLLGGRPCREDEVTMMFSQCMFAAIERMFGVHAGPTFDIYKSLNRFLILLGKLRLGLLHSAPRSC
jgi:hypothetical protein